MKLEELDKNFGPDKFDRNDVGFYDIRKAPFRICGLYQPERDEIFRRMPKMAADNVSLGVAALSENISGGRVRFKTNSPYVVLHANMPDPYMADNTPLMSKSFSLYLNYGKNSGL